jgi:hypothetical protein
MRKPSVISISIGLSLIFLFLIPDNILIKFALMVFLILSIIYRNTEIKTKKFNKLKDTKTMKNMFNESFIKAIKLQNSIFSFFNIITFILFILSFFIYLFSLIKFNNIKETFLYFLLVELILIWCMNITNNLIIDFKTYSKYYIINFDYSNKKTINKQLYYLKAVFENIEVQEYLTTNERIAINYSINYLDFVYSIESLKIEKYIELIEIYKNFIFDFNEHNYFDLFHNLIEFDKSIKNEKNYKNIINMLSIKNNCTNYNILEDSISKNRKLTSKIISFLDYLIKYRQILLFITIIVLILISTYSPNNNLINKIINLIIR